MRVKDQIARVADDRIVRDTPPAVAAMPETIADTRRTLADVESDASRL